VFYYAVQCEGVGEMGSLIPQVVNLGSNYSHEISFTLRSLYSLAYNQGDALDVRGITCPRVDVHTVAKIRTLFVLGTESWSSSL